MVKSDHELFKLEYGISDDLESRVLEMDDVCFDPIPHIYIADSAIHGCGGFIDTPVPAGYGVGWANDNGRRTILGRYINHSDEPNCYPLPTPCGFFVVSGRYIKKGEELTFNYREVMQAHILRNSVLNHGED